MDYILSLINKYGHAFSEIGAVIAFAWSVWQFFSVRSRDARSRDFENFHRLVKDLVEPPSNGASPYIDRQCAVIFELRFFPRYYPFTLRMLHGLKRNWQLSEDKYPRLLEEIEITINFIEKSSNTLSWRGSRKFIFLSSV